MGWRRGVSIVALTCAGWTVAQPQAHACICAAMSRLVAPMGDEHPVAVPLVFEHSCGGSGVEDWSVTVDGMPAMLIGSDVSEGFHGVVVEPAPAEGAEIVLMESCLATMNAEDCVLDDTPVERARFVIGPPDLVAPAAANVVLVEREAGMFGRDCDGSPTFDLKVTAEAEFGALEPGAWAVVTYLADGEPVQVEERFVPMAIELQSTFVAMASDYEGREMCVEVQTHDASGNASEVRSNCVEIPASSSGCTFGASSRAPLFVLFAFLRRRRR